MKKKEKEESTQKTKPLASSIKFPEDDESDRTGLLDLKLDDIMPTITHRKKKEPKFKPKDIIPEEELEKKDSLEDTLEEEVIPEQQPNQSYELDAQEQFSYNSSSSPSSRNIYTPSNTSSKGIASAYEGAPPGSYEGTVHGSGAYAEGTAPDQGQAHNFYDPENPIDRVGEIRGEKTSVLESAARKTKQNGFRPQRYQ